MAEMDDSVVGRGLRAPPDPDTGGTGDSPEIRPNKSRASEPGVLGEDLVFDAGKLHSRLADLLQLYLARAAEPDAIDRCSARDALTCAKALTAMMSDLQSGKPASVSKDTHWPRLESPSVGRGLRAPPFSGRAIRELPLQSICPTTKNQQPTILLDDALSVVLASDKESSIPEPHMRFIARADRLCKEVRKRLDKAQDRVRPPIQADDRRSCRLDSRRYPLGDSSVGALRLGVTVPVAAGDGDRAIRELPQQSNNQKPTTNNDSVPGLPVEDSPVLSNNQKLTTNNGVRAKARTLT